MEQNTSLGQRIKSLLVFIVKDFVYIFKYAFWFVRHQINKYPKKYTIPAITALVLIVITVIAYPFVYKYITTPRPPPFTVAPKDSGYQFQAKDNRHAIIALVGDDKTNAPKIEAKTTAGSTVSFLLRDISPSISKPSRSGNTITFSNIRNDVDVKYETLVNGLKESLIVKSPQKGNAFTFDVNAQGAKPEEIGTNLFGTSFYDEGGSYMFGFVKPYAEDANGARTDAVVLSIESDISTSDTTTTNEATPSAQPANESTTSSALDQTTSIPLTTPSSTIKYIARVIVNQKWLEDPARAYPITIDPTITYNATTQFSYGQFDRVANVNEILTYSSTNVAAGNAYTYTKALTGNGATLATGDTVEYDVYLNNNVAAVGGTDIYFTDATYARDTATWIDQNGVQCHPGYNISSYAYGKWYHRVCSVPSNFNGKTIDYIDLVNENDTATAITTYYDNFVVKSSTGSLKYSIYRSGSPAFNATHFASNGSNTGSVVLTQGASTAGGDVQTYFQELPADQYTVGLWHMNESSGNITDSSGNSNTGTVTGASVTTGVLGNARTFNGSSDYITITSEGAKFSNSNYTTEAWVYPTALGSANHFILDNRDADNDGNLMRIDTSNAFTCDYNSTTLHSVTIPVINNWYHVACTSDGSTLSVYVNGILERTTTISGSISEATDAKIGSRNFSTASNFWSGAIDEIRVSLTTRTSEEIRMDAQRRPYGVYTSDVLSAAMITGTNTLSWTELGVSTGDGETLKNTTGLVAQWNFNSTSGTTATNDAGVGTCGGTASNCDFTLNNFGSTGSQDAAAGSGWTANNKRWGAGAISLSTVATADNLSRSDPAGNVLDPNSSDLTFEQWFKTSSATGGEVFSNNNANGTSCTNNGYRWGVSSSGGVPVFRLDDDGATAGCDVVLTGPFSVVDGRWHLITVTIARGGSAIMYIDGVPVATDTVSSYSNITVTGTLYMGGSAGVFNGTIDSTRVYSRALSAAEVVSNYNVGNVEIQTRVGNTTDPNDGSWDAWKPTTSETIVDYFDSNTDSDIYTTLLLHGDSTDASTNVVDSSYPSHAMTANGNAQIDTAQSKFGGSSMLFDGTGDYVSTPNSSNWNFGTEDFTIDFWVRFNDLPALGQGTNQARNIISQTDSVPNGWAVMLWVWSGDNTHYRLNFHSKDGATSTIDTFWNTVAVNTWYHVAIVRSNGVINMYVNGSSIGSGSFTAKVPYIADALWVGSRQYNTYVNSTAFNGWIDELRITNGLARWTSGFTAPSTAYENPYTQLAASTDTTTKVQGTGSQKIANGQAIVDGPTVGLWHLDETGGSADYYKDVASNYNLTPTSSPTTVNGISGKALNFNGSSNYLSIPLAPTTSTTNWSLEAWINPANLSQLSMAIYNSNDSGGYGFGVGNGSGASGSKLQALFGGVAWFDCGYTFPSANQWYYVALTRDTTTARCYVNGVQTGNTSASTPGAVAAKFSVGMQYNSSNVATRFFAGKIDEVRVSNTVRSASEIAEAYRLGRDHYLNRTISSTDLSSTQKLAFNVAADRPGTYLEATIGESAFVNHQPDANTAGLWHLDENNQTQDSSGNGNALTTSGTTFTQGKIGKARIFNGSSDFSYCVDANCGGSTSGKLDFGASTSFSYEAWFKTSTTGVTQMIVGKQATPNSTIGWSAWVNTDNKVYCNIYDTSTHWAASSITVTDGNWHHVACTVNNSTTEIRLYLDGAYESLSFGGNHGTLDNAVSFTIGASGTPSNYFNGTIDEVRVDRVAQSAADIRASYDYGKRSHEITIDFGAKLDSGNLITGSGVTSFTVDATYYGLTNKGSNLYLGDKIIVRENYNGTTYVAQGTVNGVTASTGAVTVVSWDGGSTFPASGFTANADVFKWQREFFDLGGILSAQRDAITQLTLRETNGNEGRNVWVDNLQSIGNYLTDPTGSSITSTVGNQYFQYRIIESSNDYNDSSSITTVSTNISSNAPNAPVMTTPSNITTSSVQWNFTGTGGGGGEGIVGFKIIDSTGAIVATCVGSGLTSCVETGLTPNLTAVRRVVAYNSSGLSPYSLRATAITLAAVPSEPTTSSPASSSIQVSPNSGTNPASTEMAIYQLTGSDASSCGTGGYYLAADGTSNGSTAVWQTQANWGALAISGLDLDTYQYTFCAKARNANNIETGWAGNSTNGGYIPLSGNFTMNGNMTFSNTRTDGNDGARTVGGLDVGPLVWWRYDGSPSDSSSHSFSWYTGLSSSTTGKYGNGISMSGISSTYTRCDETLSASRPSSYCGGIGNLDFGIPTIYKFSYGGWFKVNGNPASDKVIVGKKAGTGNSAGYEVTLNSTGKVTCTIADGSNSASTASTSTNMADNSWHYVFCVNDGTNLSVYVDGTPQNSTSISAVTGSLDNTGNFTAGNSSDGTRALTGTLDEIRVYGTDLNQNQIQYDMNNANSPQNVSKLTLASGTLTIQQNETIGVGQIVFPNGSQASIALPSDQTGQIKLNSPIWAYSADGDRYATTSTYYYGTQPSNGVRRNALKLSSADCDDTVAATGTVFGTYCSVTATGSGKDGSATVSTSVNLSSTAIGNGGYSTTEGGIYQVTALGTNTITTAVTFPSPNSIFGPGDEVMLINVGGDSTNHGNVGNYETLLLKVAGGGQTFTTYTNIQKIYGATSSNSDLTGQKVLMIRVPNYTSVTVNSGGTITTSTWAGTTGAILAMRATGAVTVSNGGSITTSSLAYRGGAGGTGPGSSTTQEYGYQGESHQGTGALSTSASLGAGGGGQGSAAAFAAGGGGGGYGVAGTIGSNGSNPTNTPGNPGATYGSTPNALLFFGSAGGGGASDWPVGNTGGTGGKGGGIIFISAGSVTIAGGISANGAVGGNASGPNANAGGGGGSGGSIYLYGSSGVTLGSSLVTATGGSGGTKTGSGGAGGAGGAGRISVHGASSGTTNPTYTSF